MTKRSKVLPRVKYNHANPVFLLDTGARRRDFWQNVRAACAPVAPAADDADNFWKDVFVVRPVPWMRMAQSLTGHAALIALVVMAVRFAPKPAHVMAADLPRRPEVIYYSPSEYLTPLSTLSPTGGRSLQGDPVASNQHILSVPPEADNRSQTIVTPSPLEITHDVQTPNIVAWNEKPAIPVAATRRDAANLNVPALTPQVVPPQPQVSSELRRNNMTLAQTVVAPAPEVKMVTSSHAALETPAVVPPPPEANQLHSARPSEVNLAPAAVNATPRLPTELQRTVSGRTAPSLGLDASGAVVPPPPSSGEVGSAGDYRRGAGQLIALGIHPDVSNGSLAVPQGNRRGTFEASPQGKAGASGSPTLQGDPAARGSGSGGSGRSNSLPPGLMVEPSPGPVGSHSASSPGSAGNGTGSGTGRTSTPPTVAKLTVPRISTLPTRSSVPIAETSPADLARRIFGDRKIYTMNVNVPNLNSAGGSWQVRFAQKKDAEAVPGELTAPQPLREVDPAYPTQLMRENVEGTVALYAIIESDGTVSRIQILHSIDDRLDQYAAAALAKWTFRPAEKNGSKVPLEAVVLVPFKAIRQRSNF